MTVKRFLFDHEVKSVHGTQTFYVDADSLEEARALMASSGGTFYAQEIEVTDLGEPEPAGETTLDDTGDLT
jgi:hypothetical protein